MPISKLRFSENLTVVMGHVAAVQAVDRYLSGGGLDEDWSKVHEHLKQEVERKHPSLRQWQCTAKGCDSYWQPSKWKGAGLRLGILTPSPVEEDGPDAYVYLYVPEKWRKRKPLDARLLELQRLRQNFAHYQDPRHQGFSAECPVWVWVRYQRFARRGGGFDWAGFD